MTMGSMQQQGRSARAMALVLGRSPSTITRELARNTMADLPYGSHTAQVACVGRRAVGSADQGNQALGNRFGDWSRSSGCRPTAAVL